ADLLYLQDVDAVLLLAEYEGGELAAAGGAVGGGGRVLGGLCWRGRHGGGRGSGAGRWGSGGGRHRRGLGQPAGVDDQRDAAVAEDGGAGDAGDALVVGLEVLDHDLLLAEQFVDLEREPAAVGLDHHRDRRRRVLAARGRRQAVLRGQVDQRDVVVAHAQHAGLAGD